MFKTTLYCNGEGTKYMYAIRHVKAQCESVAFSTLYKSILRVVVVRLLPKQIYEHDDGVSCV